jgi:hypothetical protein
MVKKKPTTVKFNHKFPDDYRIVAVNGAWGGISPRGDLLMHFFIEHKTVPDQEIKSLKEDGSFDDSKDFPTEIEIDRKMQIGVMMPREQAASLAHWILDKIQHFESDKKTKR